MSWLLDTCAVSEPLRKHPDDGFTQWNESKDADDLFISSITVGELEKGIWLLPSSTKRKRLEKWFREELVPFFSGRILGFGELEALA